MRGRGQAESVRLFLPVMDAAPGAGAQTSHKARAAAEQRQGREARPGLSLPFSARHSGIIYLIKLFP